MLHDNKRVTHRYTALLCRTPALHTASSLQIYCTAMSHSSPANSVKPPDILHCYVVPQPCPQRQASRSTLPGITVCVVTQFLHLVAMHGPNLGKENLNTKEYLWLLNIQFQIVCLYKFKLTSSVKYERIS